MQTYCSYCGNPLDIDEAVSFQLGEKEINSCEGECLIYLYQEYQQDQGFTTWITTK